MSTIETLRRTAGAAANPRPGTAPAEIFYRTLNVNGLDIFYREAGPRPAPTVLLLHGFPSSSHMFRDLMGPLAAYYHVIAPDYPGFGHSSTPAPGDFEYSFANLAGIIGEFVEKLGLESYVVYMQDYGGPVGMRLVTKHPERVRGLVIQNAVVNVEGWNPDVVASFAAAWRERTAETEQPLRDAFSAEGTRFQYVHGATRADRVNPDAWTYDQVLLDRPGNDRIQVELLYRYQDNIALYPEWQDCLRRHQPPTLVVWGDNDPFFTAAGRDFYKSLIPAAEVHAYDAGHFALETHAPEIASAMLGFLGHLE